MAERLKILFKYQHIIVVAYHPRANSMAECRMREVGAHLRSLVYVYRINSEWIHYLPLAQRITIIQWICQRDRLDIILKIIISNFEKL